MSHFKQENGYGCGVYALANALIKESIITPRRLEESKKGNNIGQLNKWLIEDGYDLFLEPLYFSATENRLPKSICDIHPKGDGVLGIPVFIDVQMTKSSKMHFVAAEITKEGTLLVIDSLKDEKEMTTLFEYQKRFYRVFGLWHLRPYYEEGYFMRIDEK